MTRKYLVCRPMGGLNDMMNRIVMSIEYCIRYNRILIIDSINSEFGSDILDLFNPLLELIQSSRNFNESNFKGLSVYPNFISGKVFEYQSIYKHGTKNFIECGTQSVMEFDYFKDYDEHILINNLCGGGVHSHRFLKYFTVTDHILEALKIRINQLGASYIGIHVRNTDIKTTYLDMVRELFGNYSSDNGLFFFLATDSLEAKKRIFEAADQLKVGIKSFSHSLSVDGSPIHRDVNLTETEIVARNKEAILDLLTLIMARKIFYSVGPCGEKSGFSVLAEGLAASEYKLDLNSRLSPQPLSGYQ
jgi:hypothetical protein